MEEEKKEIDEVIYEHLRKQTELLYRALTSFDEFLKTWGENYNLLFDEMFQNMMMLNDYKAKKH